jgi:5-methylcytosine-specific restriction endonuclease McrA
VVLLVPHLTADNCVTVLEAARHRSRREVEQQVAALRPLPSVATIVRKLPPPKLAASELPVERGETLIPSDQDARQAADREPAAPMPPVRPAVLAPLAPERFKLQVTISRATHDKLRRVQDLLRHSVPNGDPAEILDRALTLLLADLERSKLALTERPRQAKNPLPGSRHVPAAVRREVWKRDEGRCAFIGTAGRCAERGFLEFHHVRPFAEGGETTIANLQLRCRAHNHYEAEAYFGSGFLRERQVAYEPNLTRS